MNSEEKLLSLLLTGHVTTDQLWDIGLRPDHFKDVENSVMYFVIDSLAANKKKHTDAATIAAESAYTTQESKAATVRRVESLKSALTDADKALSVPELCAEISGKAYHRQVIETAHKAIESVTSAKTEAVSRSAEMLSRIGVPLSADDWTREPKPTPQLFKHGADDFLPQGKVGMIIGEGGAGKTQALIQMALAVATDTKWFNLYQAQGAGKVAVLLGEEDQETILRRAQIAHREQWASNGELVSRITPLLEANFCPMGLASFPVGFVQGKQQGKPEGEETQWARDLRKRLDETGPWKLIILDPLSRWAGPSVETDNYVSTRMVEVCEQLTTISGNPTVIVAAHTSKAQRTDTTNQGKKEPPAMPKTPRGSSGLYDGARWVMGIAVDDENDSVIIEVTKSNYSRRAGRQILKRGEGGYLKSMQTDYSGIIANGTGGFKPQKKTENP